MTTIADSPIVLDDGEIVHTFLSGGLTGITTGGETPEPEPEPGPEVWSSGQSLTPQLVRGVGVRGTVFSVQFSSDEAGTPWTVHRLVNHMRARRNPSVTRTEVKG